MSKIDEIIEQIDKLSVHDLCVLAQFINNLVTEKTRPTPTPQESSE